MPRADRINPQALLAVVDGGGLFADRATAIDSSFALSEINGETVATICQRLDGMPLAIEVAAARILVMNPTDLLTGLDDRFRLLSGGRRRQRQRTLEATLDWSYDLLDPEEQRVLRALGVFVDGFDLDAIAAVASLSRPIASDLIESLVAKSLVVRADKDGDVRFKLLETVKAYAEDRMLDAAETNSGEPADSASAQTERGTLRAVSPCAAFTRSGIAPIRR